MTISEEELNAKRLRVAHLRREISSLRTEGSSTRVAAEREITNRALDEEIVRLESQVVDAAKSAGGTVEDAIAAMERAAAVQQMATPAKDEDDDDDDETTDTSDVKVGATESPVPAPEQPKLGASHIINEDHDETDEEVSR